MTVPLRAAPAFVLAMLAAAAGVPGCAGDAEPDTADAREPTSGSEAGATPAPDAAPATDARPLPATTKGYELYAWDETGELAFALVTGTNRLKTAAEITASGDVVEGEHVILHGAGVDALARVLARVPQATSVVLSSVDGLPALSASGRSEVERVLAAAGHGS